MEVEAAVEEETQQQEVQVLLFYLFQLQIIQGLLQAHQLLQLQEQTL